MTDTVKIPTTEYLELLKDKEALTAARAEVEEAKAKLEQFKCEAPCRHEWYLGQCAHCGIAAPKHRL